MSFDEARLIQGLKAGDKRAFRELVEKTRDHIYNVSFSFVKNKEDAEDISQRVYMDVLKNVDKFREDSKLSTWMYRIAVNRSLNHLRGGKRRRQQYSLDDMMRGDGVGYVPAAEEEDKDYERDHSLKVKLLYRAIEDLPENQRIAINLNKFEKLPYQEVADIMGLSLSAVTALISRAKGNLQKKLKKEFEKIAQG